MSDSMPSNFQIFDYWKDKWLFDEPVILDWAEPTCWCCGKSIGDEPLKATNLKTVWMHTSGKLQRCHIIPKSLGGENTPENLFLMCKRCHEQAPNSDSVDAFLEWVSFKRKRYIWGIDMATMINLAQDYCRQSCISFEEFCESASQLELPQKVSTHGPHVTESTVLMLLLQSFKTSRQVAATQETR